MNKGDLIRFKGTGEMATVISETYTYRFMEAEDYEMEAHGMGHMAGSYGGAFDVIVHKTGRKRRIAMSNRIRFDVIDENFETAE